MKKVIFLCLLSLSVCLSKPATDEASPVPAQTATKSTAVDTKDQKVEQAATNVTEPQAPAKAPAAATDKNPPEHETKAQPPMPASQPATAVPMPKEEAAKPTEDNKTTDKNTPPKENKEKEAVPMPTEKVTEKPTNDTKPTEKAKIETTTTAEKVVPTKPTEAPKTTEAPKSDADKHIVQARGFDGASFIGGIVLTMGLLAIGFMGFKYYKNQSRNYHTL